MRKKHIDRPMLQRMETERQWRGRQRERESERESEREREGQR